MGLHSGPFSNKGWLAATVFHISVHSVSSIEGMSKTDVGAFDNDFFEPNPLVLDKESSVAAAIETASDFVGESIPVVDLETHTLVGVITEADLLQAYLELQNDARAIEN